MDTQSAQIKVVRHEEHNDHEDPFIHLGEPRSPGKARGLRAQSCFQRSTFHSSVSAEWTATPAFCGGEWSAFTGIANRWADRSRAAANYELYWIRVLRPQQLIQTSFKPSVWPPLVQCRS